MKRTCLLLAALTSGAARADGPHAAVGGTAAVRPFLAKRDADRGVTHDAAAERALTWDRRLFGTRSDPAADGLGVLAAALERAEKWEPAATARREALDIRTALHGPAHWRVTDARLAREHGAKLPTLSAEQRAKLRAADDKLAAADRAFTANTFQEIEAPARMALAVRREVLGEDHWLTAAAWHMLTRANPADGKAAAERAVAVRAKVLGDGHPDTARSRINLGFALQRMNQFDAARAQYRRASAALNAALGEGHESSVFARFQLAFAEDFAGDLAAARDGFRATAAAAVNRPLPLVEIQGQALVHAARVGVLLNKPAEAERDARAAVAALRPLGAAAVSPLADSLYWLGMARANQGDTAAAKRHMTECLALHRRLPPDRRFAIRLSSFGLLHEVDRDWPAALAARREAVELNRRLSDIPPAVLADALLQLAEALSETGDPTADRPLAEVADLAQKSGPDRPRLEAEVSDRRGKRAEQQGDAATAEKHYLEAIAVLRPHPARRSQLGRVLYHLGHLYLSALDRPASARDAFREAMTCWDAAGGVWGGMRESMTGLLAVACTQTGDFAEAVRLHDRCVAQTRALPPADPVRFEALLNRAAVYAEIGDVRAAEAGGDEMARWVDRYARPDGYERETLLAFRAALRLRAGEYEAAGRLAEAAVAAFDRHPLTEPNDVSGLGMALNVAHIAAFRTNRPAAARQAADRMIALWNRHRPDGLDAAVAANNLAVVATFQGDLATARAQAAAAGNRFAGRLPVEHQLAINYRYVLGQLAARGGDPAAARPHLEAALGGYRTWADRLAAVKTEGQQLADHLEFDRLSAEYLGTVADPAAYDHVLWIKGSVADRQQAARRLRQADPDAQKLVSQLLDVSHQLTQPAPDSTTLTRRLIERDRLERELSAKLPAAKPAAAPTAAAVAAGLPAGSALIDFQYAVNVRDMWCDRLTPDVPKRLLAFVVRPGAAVGRVDLGPAGPIEAAVGRWRAVHADGTPAAGPDPAAELRTAVWEKLEPHLGGATTVFLSPVGPLAGLPFAALPGAKPDSYLVEQYTFAAVPVPRRLAAPPDRPAGEPSLLLVGGVDFGRPWADPAGAAGGGPLLATAGAAALVTVPDHRELPGTVGEAAAVRDDFEKAFRGRPVVKLDEADATKAAFLAAAPTHRFLHLATHGFFAEEAAPPAAGDRAAAVRVDRRLAGVHPGLLSGVVFAGLNGLPPAARPRAVLSALEAGELDLRGVELVTLAACQTGLGRTAGGEGVLGLQRAFQVAGARNCLATLWAVDDAAAQRLMTRFYQNLWRKGRPPAQALREAQLAALADPTLRNLGRSDAGRAPPRLWAGFVLAGDPR